MGLVVQDQPKVWSVQSTRFHGQNVVRCKVISGSKRNPLIGAYLPSSTLEHLPDLEEALTQFLVQDLILLGNLNSISDQAQNLRSQQVADLLIDFGLVDLLHRFWQRWILHLGTDQRQF